MQLTALCRSAGGWDEVDDVRKILELRRDPRQLVWAEADVSGAAEDDVRDLAAGFALDELAIDDALNPRQRPKLEPQAARTCAGVMPSRRPPRLRPGAKRPFRGGAAAAGATRTSAAARTRIRRMAKG